ncbi:serine/threonine protein kinase [Labilithrix luteola]|uniref:Serine/threonine protein kinase n=1 Tax=Labilithrix luteola TaxID=1391654 RepID=A0A0K1PKM2_9BACT|nr:serine/threonine protein kinase [Labilithrix luteola]
MGERYSLHEPIAAGGTAKVYYGRLHGIAGFSKLVAIKRIHTRLGADEDVSTLLDEARLGARVAHPNVVQVLDVVESAGETFLVMEYIHGEPLSVVIRSAETAGGIPPSIAATIVAQALYGLHAAHEALSEKGKPLGIVHRDVSPQNILVGHDGVARLLDFGIATTQGASSTTTRVQLKGKLGYMAPELLEGTAPASRRVDIYAAAVCLWEALSGSRLFDGDTPGHVCMRILHERVGPPSALVAGIPPELDAVVMRGLARDPAERHATALEMAAALERAITPATPREVAAWLESNAGTGLADRARTIHRIEDAERPSMAGGTPVRLRFLLDWGPAVVLVLLIALGVWALPRGEAGSVLQMLHH